jgi:hypothetical protein
MAGCFFDEEAALKPQKSPEMAAAGAKSEPLLA